MYPYNFSAAYFMCLRRCEGIEISGKLPIHIVNDGFLNLFDLKRIGEF